MGRYTCKLIDEATLKDIILTIREGYTDHEGIKHRANPQMATILLLQANLGCRIGDIVNLKVENIVFDGEAWRLNLIEEKTGKLRPYIVPSPVKQIIDNYCKLNRIESGRLFTVTEQAVWKQMRYITKYLGLEETSCHSLRKNAALRVYLNSGKDIALTSQFLNHSSPSTSLRYLKRSNKQMDDIISQTSITI